MREMFSLVKLAAGSDLPVLISGDRGTGKKLIAREIHRLSVRCDKPLVVWDCIALPDAMVVANLFGSVGGCFGGNEVHPGILERAGGGTVVVGNVFCLHPNCQARLARAFQAGEFRRIRSDVAVKFDARLIVTSRNNLPELVASGEFQQELYACVNALSIHVPRLRERREDIAALLEHYLPLAAAGLGLPPKKLAPEVLEFFLSYPWPGNISELQAILELSLLHSGAATVRLDDLPSEMTRRWTIFLPR
jgi:DNA-binding NtrC family response regulator